MSQATLQRSVASPANSALPSRVFQADPQAFRDKFNRLPFQFRHTLADHPLFELSNLARIAEQMHRSDPKKITYFTGNARIDQRWDLEPGQPGTLREAIDRINESGSWVLLKGVHTYPEFGALMEQIIDEEEQLSGRRLRSELTWPDAYIFIASPGSITPFHIDHEITFLFQIHGSKEAHVFDPHNRQVVSEEELEQYYAGELSAASYTEDKQPHSHIFHQQPGLGIHHPSLAGHWVRNGPEYSITLNINLCLRSLERLARVRQANHYLRGWGLKPAPPGGSALRDGAKAAVMEALSFQGKPPSKYHLIRRGVMRIDAVRRLLHRNASGRPSGAAS